MFLPPSETRSDSDLTRPLKEGLLRPCEREEMRPIMFPADCTVTWRGPSAFLAQHFLYFLPDPHGHGSLRPTFVIVIASLTERGILIQSLE